MTILRFLRRPKRAAGATIRVIQRPVLDADAWADVAEELGDHAKKILLDKLAPERVPTEAELRAASLFSRMVRETVSRIARGVQGERE